MWCSYCGERAWYRCARTGNQLCPRHARLEVVGTQGEGEVEGWGVRAARSEDLSRLQELSLHFWGETEVECFDRVYDVVDLPGLVAVAGADLVGFLSYAVEGDRTNVVMLTVVPEYQGRGIGSALLESAMEQARRLGLSRLVVATSNDDLPALYLYQRAGFTITEVLPGRLVEHHGGLEEGFAGVPVRDEIRLQFLLGGENRVA